MIENFGLKSIKSCKELKDFTCEGDKCTNGTNSLNKTDFEKYKEKCVEAVICTTPPQLKLQAAESVHPEVSRFLKKSNDINGELSTKNFLLKFFAFSIDEIVEIFIVS